MWKDVLWIIVACPWLLLYVAWLIDTRRKL